MKKENNKNLYQLTISYYGIGLAGKMTICSWLKKEESSFLSEEPQELLNLRPPISLDGIFIGQKSIKFKLFTASYHRNSKSMNWVIFKISDGIFFVFDSRVQTWELNLYALKNLLKLYSKMEAIINNVSINEIPLIILANKRDLDNIIEISQIKRVLKAAKIKHVPIFEIVATEGKNVKTSLIKMTSEILKRKKKNN
ncbi:MAG: hypothetical protein EU548_06065 [Promethearchaeota archaeon]|nr:MAG: hypothetical protein EU548_06065 [Candidatus Lokiarchaeota archaeon]